MSNDVSFLFDMKDETSWQEGVDGYGIGEYLSILLDSEHEIRYMGFKLGNWKNMDLYTENARPKTLFISFGDFQQEITFTGEVKTEWVAFENIAPAKEITIRIEDVFTGTIYDDTCIAEIMIYGR